ncbi:MAG: hypothetical protein ACUVSX_05095 [Aggregatilineales bacterium]
MFTTLLMLAGSVFVAHLLFSSYGFNPTDDGFTLAYSRRILDGQIPHRDFIIIRPFLSPLIHVPVVALGGPYTYWLSRLVVWAQFVTIVWLWLVVIQRSLSAALPRAGQFVLLLLGVMLSAHNFPLMAWSTIDGLLLLALGAFALSAGARWRLPAYALIGSAVLCKQSFMLILPLSLIIAGDWRDIRCWVAGLLPGALYALFVVLTGGLAAAQTQLLSQTDGVLLSSGVIAYLPYGFVAAWGGLMTALMRQSRRPGLLLALLIGLPLSLAIAAFAVGLLIFQLGFFVFALLAGLAVYAVASRALPSAQTRVILLVLAGGWSASLSGGYVSPILMAGPLMIALVVYANALAGPPARQQWARWTFVLGVALLALAFVNLRLNHIYRERPTSEMAYHLGDLLPGAQLIFTNANTYRYFEDLSRAIERATALGHPYALIPDCPGCWVQSPQPNPLPIDWTLDLYKNPTTIAQTIDRLERLRAAGGVIILQEVDANTIANAAEPLPVELYDVVPHVRQRFDVVGATTYFTLYR